VDSLQPHQRVLKAGYAIAIVLLVVQLAFSWQVAVHAPQSAGGHKW
jgi:hypothetical protein